MQLLVFAELFIIAFLLFICLQGLSQQPIFVNNQNLLYSVTLNNCTKRLVGSGTQGYGDIAFPPDGRLWGISNGDIYQIDSSNANAVLVGFVKNSGVSLVALNDSSSAKY